MEQKPLCRFKENPRAREDKKNGFRKGRNVLHLAVSVLMVFVGRFVGDNNRRIRHQRGDQIKPGVCGFGENAETVCL